jgi:small subunit ribosomal protein S1
MIHISELARGYIKEARDVVKEGDEVDAKVLNVDPQKRQIRLSLKALQPEIAPLENPEPAPKSPKKGKRPQPAEQESDSSEPAAPQLTSMQMAWQSAQDRAKSEAKGGRVKRTKPNTSEQEEILSRTLEKRLPTGA